jgi:hypothetical protein
VVGVAAIVVGLAMTIGLWGDVERQNASAVRPSVPLERFVPAPESARLVDTRPGETTIDGLASGVGELAAESELEVQVGGRAGFAWTAAAVVLNVTVAGAAEPGFVVAYPCDVERPLASNLNYVRGTTRAAMVIVELDDSGAACLFVSGRTHLIVDAVGSFETGDAVGGAPVRLLDSRPGASTVDGAYVGEGPVAAGSTVRVGAVGRAGMVDGAGSVVLNVTMVTPASPGYAAAFTCGAAESPSSTVNAGAGEVAANLAVVRPDESGDVCVFVSTDTHLVVDATGQLATGAIELPDRPRRVLDTRVGEPVAAGAAGIVGVRHAGSTTSIPVTGVDGIPAGAAAALVNVTTVFPDRPGFIATHPSGGTRPGTSTLNYVGGDVVANAAVVPLGPDGQLCMFSSASTHAVIDVLGWLPGPAPAGEGGCADDSLFPGRRIVALYGNDVAAALGVLGEQPPAEAADRLARVAQPFEAGDRPVQGAFELIATIATSGPGSDGLYRSVSSEAHVQRYLDVARERGLLLILDIQPGRSDFLTEVRRYDRFLRDPIVHVALDPEWRMGPDQVPGQVVGQVDATEVNAVARHLASIVAAEGLPDKLLVVHQFQDRMLTNRPLLVQPPGVVVAIHMDGFGTQEQKLATYGVVRAEPPLWNGFKLFYDEDIDMFTPAEVLALDPVPDLVTYQ